ncbi:MAG: divergent polysaccharide deacetylase family protein, partial [Treponema sp.]|nr:divergent polysaccharide deacetylase family protein [Treponema sp.]
LDPFLKFPGPLTIAVLPGLPYSAEAAKRIRAAGKEVILHQPMEAIGGQNPGPGAIYSDMTQEEIEAVLKKNLAQVGPVVGMNNHQGSKITADERIMEIVLAFCRRNGIYYLDSRTTAETAVPAVAERMGIRIGERDVFVDNIQEKAAMIRFMEEGLQKAEKKGAAIVIGHVWSNELAATLSELYPELIAQGFSLTTVSRIMMGTFEDEGFGD